MVETYLLTALTIGIFFISISIIQLKRQKMGQGTFVIWSLIGFSAIIIGVVPSSVSLFQDLLGTQLSVSALLGIGVIFLFILVFYFHQKIDFLNQRITKLVSELAANRFYKSKEKED